MYLILSAGKIAGTLNMCLCPHVSKTLLYSKCSLVSKFIRCIVCLSICLLLHIPFQLHSLQFILAKCPIRLLKYYTGNWNCRLQIISYLNLEAHIFRYPGAGRKTKCPGGCVWNLKFGNPLPAAVSLTPS